MWYIQILGVDLYHVLFWLILYSFMGWIWESCYVSIKEKKLVNRGFVTGPVCTIYGVGAMSVYLVLRPLQDHGLWLFLGGIVLATILEYVTSWVMEKLFHTSWWDYSERPFNLHGRICLGCSIAWGFFTLLMFEILQPFAQWVIDLFDVATGHAFIILCGILYCVDFIVSTLAALQLGEKLEGLQTAMEEFTEYLQTTKVYSSTEEARELFGNYKKHLPTKKEFQEKLGEYQRRIAGKIEEKGLSEYAEGIRSRSKGFREQYQERVSRITGVNKSIMKAYPTIHKVSRKKKGNQKETK